MHRAKVEGSVSALKQQQPLLEAEVQIAKKTLEMMCEAQKEQKINSNRLHQLCARLTLPTKQTSSWIISVFKKIVGLAADRRALDEHKLLVKQLSEHQRQLDTLQTLLEKCELELAKSNKPDLIEKSGKLIEMCTVLSTKVNLYSTEANRTSIMAVSTTATSNTTQANQIKSL